MRAINEMVVSRRSTQRWLIDWLKPTFGRDQYVIYLFGCFLFSFGACCFIESKLGTDPLDVFSLGLQNHFHWVTIGLAQGGFAALMLFIWAFWNKKLPIISPFITFFFCGSLIDVGRYWAIASLIHFSNFPLIPLIA